MITISMTLLVMINMTLLLVLMLVFSCVALLASLEVGDKSISDSDKSAKKYKEF